MKKKKLIILISVLAVVIAAFGYFAFMHYTATTVKNKFYRYFIADNEDIERLSRLPQQIEIQNDSKPGYTVHFQDFSLTLSGYDKVVIDDNFDDDSISLYHIDDDKFIMFRDTAPAKNDFIFNDATLSSCIEKTAGKKINSEYGYMEASFYSTPEDFSLFDASKNKGVVLLLGTKESNTDDTCYQFDNGTVRGFIIITTPQNIMVLFFNCNIPGSYYVAFFTKLSIEEVKEILSTITFYNNSADQ